MSLLLRRVWGLWQTAWWNVIHVIHKTKISITPSLSLLKKIGEWNELKLPIENQATYRLVSFWKILFVLTQHRNHLNHSNGSLWVVSGDTLGCRCLCCRKVEKFAWHPPFQLALPLSLCLTFTDVQAASPSLASCWKNWVKPCIVDPVMFQPRPSGPLKYFWAFSLSISF